MEYANLDGYFWNNTTTPGSKNGSRELNAFHVISLVLGNSQLVIFSRSTSPINSMGRGHCIPLCMWGEWVTHRRNIFPRCHGSETQLAQHANAANGFYTRCWVMQLQKQNSEIQAPLQKWNKHFPLYFSTIPLFLTQTQLSHSGFSCSIHFSITALSMM